MYPGLYDGSCETQRRTGGAFLGGFIAYNDQFSRFQPNEENSFKSLIPSVREGGNKQVRQIGALLVGPQPIQPGEVPCFAYLCPRMARSGPDHGQVYLLKQGFCDRGIRKRRKIFSHTCEIGDIARFSSSAARGRFPIYFAA